MLDARTATMRGRSRLEPSMTRLASPPVACASGFNISVVEVTSEKSFGLVGPTLIKAFGAGHYRSAGRVARLDGAKEPAPVRRLGARAFEPPRYRIAFADVA